jgi:hypothetical protein
MGAQLAAMAGVAWFIKIKNPDADWPVAAFLGFCAVYWVTWGICKLMDVPARLLRFVKQPKP